MNSQAGRLLIVDDNDGSRDMLARRLENEGYTVSTAQSGNQLFEHIGKEEFDLVLLGIEMPDMSGLEAIKILRKTHTLIQLPIIMVTAHNQREDIVKALDLGANDYLTRPIDFPVALAHVKTQLSVRRAEQALRESEERYA